MSEAQKAVFFRQKPSHLRWRSIKCLLPADTVRFHVKSWKAAQALPSSELFGKQVSWAAGLMGPVTTPLADATATVRDERRTAFCPR